MRTAIAIRALSAAALVAGGCGGGGDSCPVAAEGCECTGGGVCDPGLACVDDVCVPVDADAETDPDAPADTAADTPADDAEGEAGCGSDGDCDDGVFCNGAETCGEGGECEAGGPPDCDDGDPCTADSCDEDTASCANDGIDEDGDGFAAAIGPGGEACAGTDCDDGDAGAFPGAARTCVDADMDCTGHADRDEDGDGHLGEETCPGAGDDCDDSDAEVHPAADPACGGEDRDCSGFPDEDEDQDGFRSAAICAGTGTDCDDSNPTVNPGVVPSCQAFDANCDGIVENDHDGDGYIGFACGGDDCDDAHAIAHPGAGETCQDGIDGDCDGLVDGLAPAAGSPVQVSEAAGRSSEVAADWSGTAFGVVWRDSRTTANLYFGQVSPAGAKIGSDVQITTGGYIAEQADVAWTGSEWGVVWKKNSAYTFDVYFARLAASGDKVGSDILLVSVDDGGVGNPSIAWTGTEYGIAWEYGFGSSYYRRIAYTHLTPEGTRLTSWAEIAGGFAYWYRPSLVWAGSQFGVAYSSTSAGLGYDVFFSRFSPEGVVLGSRLNVTAVPADQDGPTMAWSGSQFGVAWANAATTPGQIGFARVNQDGTKSGTSAAVVPSGSGPRSPSIAWAGTVFGIAWVDELYTADEDLYVTLVTGAGAVAGTDVRLNGGVIISYVPDLVWSGSGFGVAFESRPASDDETFMALAGFCE